MIKVAFLSFPLLVAACAARFSSPISPEQQSSILTADVTFMP